MHSYGAYVVILVTHLHVHTLGVSSAPMDLLLPAVQAKIRHLMVRAVGVVYLDGSHVQWVWHILMGPPYIFRSVIARLKRESISCGVPAQEGRVPEGGVVTGQVHHSGLHRHYIDLIGSRHPNEDWQYVWVCVCVWVGGWVCVSVCGMGLCVCGGCV